MGALDLGAVELVSVEPAGARRTDTPTCELCEEPVEGESWSLTVRSRATQQLQDAPLCAPCADAYDWLVDVLRTPRTGRTDAHAAPWRGGRS